MSLKAFHILFISLSILLAWGFGGWCLWSYFKTSNGGRLGLGLLSLGVGIALICYEVWFIKKLKRMSDKRRPM